jgi:L-alanine-DL-glutamate epimerase-like enolase superfamily enzyme
LSICRLRRVDGIARVSGEEAQADGGGAENLAVLGAIDNSRCYERGLLQLFIDHDAPPPWLRAPSDPMDERGVVSVSRAPGLGLEIDFDYIAASTVSAGEGA